MRDILIVYDSKTTCPRTNTLEIAFRRLCKFSSTFFNAIATVRASKEPLAAHIERKHTTACTVPYRKNLFFMTNNVVTPLRQERLPSHPISTSPFNPEGNMLHAYPMFRRDRTKVKNKNQVRAKEHRPAGTSSRQRQRYDDATT